MGEVRKSNSPLAIREFQIGVTKTSVRLNRTEPFSVLPDVLWWTQTGIHLAGRRSYGWQTLLVPGRKRSGHIRAVGRRNHAADHAAADLGVAANTASALGLDDPPGRTISHQRCQHGVIELVAWPHRAIGAKQGQTGKRQIADGVQNLVAGAV